MGLPTLQQELARRRIQDPQDRATALMLRDGDGTLLGTAKCAVFGGKGREVMQAQVRVPPVHRGQGAGRRLVAEAARVAAGDGCRLLEAMTSQPVASAEAFCRRLGAKPGLR